MNAEIQVETGDCLLIFDPHQNKRWVQDIVDRERANVSHILLGGDYFDAYESQEQVSAGEMASYLRELVEEWGDRITVLLGNHDIPYMEAQPFSAHKELPFRMQNHCPGWTNEKSIEIASKLDGEFWKRTRFFQLVNGHLVSHAGLAKSFWPEDVESSVGLERLEGLCEIIKENISCQSFPLLACGHSRGGDALVGGITWQDWDLDFKDDLDFPQIVGHSRDLSVRQKGRSWCLDAAQTSYAILPRKGRLEIYDA